MLLMQEQFPDDVECLCGCQSVLVTVEQITTQDDTGTTIYTTCKVECAGCGETKRIIHT